MRAGEVVSPEPSSRIRKSFFLPINKSEGRLNFIPVALEQFPKTFGITDEGKQFFPHLWNTAANIYCPQLPNLPPKEHYLYSSMKPEKRRHFLEWYEGNKGQHFDLKEKLVEYCMSDVRLLSEGLVNYRQTFLEECRFEVLERCTTLPAAMMTHFRMNLLKKDSIAVASELSYERHDKQSSVARKYLRWYAHQNKVEVQHVESADGEKRLTANIYLDGYVKGGLDGNSNDVAIEVNGYVSGRRR
jgi:hypothetical protein